MLKLKHDGREINVRFDHSITRICSVTDTEFTELDDERRCTWAQVIFPDEHMIFNGEAICHPKDNYCKSTGRKLALTVAMKSFDRDLRKTIWQEYHKHCK